jgi:hypothetical protein
MKSDFIKCDNFPFAIVETNAALSSEESGHGSDQLTFLDRWPVYQDDDLLLIGSREPCVVIAGPLASLYCWGDCNQPNPDHDLKAGSITVTCSEGRHEFQDLVITQIPRFPSTEVQQLRVA